MPSSSKITWSWRISATFLRIMMVELPESAAHLATDPTRVYYLGAGRKSCHAPGAPLFLTRPCLRPPRRHPFHTHARRSEAGASLELYVSRCGASRLLP